MRTFIIFTLITVGWDYAPYMKTADWLAKTIVWSCLTISFSIALLQDIKELTNDNE